MYLVGASHPNKLRVIDMVPRLTLAGETLVTSAETFQEIIHRYRAAKDEQHLYAAYEALSEMTQETLSVTRDDVDKALALSGKHKKLSSRDCLHAAIMKRIGADSVWSFDKGFEELPWVVRVS
ncbi:MAG: type II toxin-antitoxin system VapC family toxin [Deltaproteobacteria bacterium]|nr:type II toxin-antitoxin system VapC family toxin [Deltaproteobacteria bacterium]